MITAYVFQYNEQRLHSSIGYVTPLAKLNCEEVAIFAERKEKLAAAQMARKEIRRVMWNWRSVSPWLTQHNSIVGGGAKSKFS